LKEKLKTLEENFFTEKRKKHEYKAEVVRLCKKLESDKRESDLVTMHLARSNLSSISELS